MTYSIEYNIKIDWFIAAIIGEQGLFLTTVDSHFNGYAYNKNPSLTIFLFVPMQLFLLFSYNGYNNFSL